MTDRNHPDPPPAADSDGGPEDPALRAAGDRLRAEVDPLPAARVRAAALGRRNRHLAIFSGIAVLAVVLLAGVLVAQIRRDDPAPGRPTDPGGPDPAEVDAILADLPAEPVDPTEVKLVRTVSTFDSCPALLDDLRRVGAEHVGSRGFGGGPSWGPPGFWADEGYGMEETAALPSRDGPVADSGAPGGDGSGDAGGETLGTNVQVAGVDEPDHVKAEGRHIYDLAPGGELRITEGRTGEVEGTVPLTSDEHARVDSLLVADGRVAVFGTEIETSEPIEGDPSATRVTTSSLTVTLVDATDPADPVVVERVRIDGSIVSARLVDGDIRLVTTSQLADIGFVMPTTGNSVEVALDANRRAVASSEITDWIPNWNADGGAPAPLVPCERVHVPDTFAGVAMTSMVTFPIAADGFQPNGTGILAPADTLYAGVDRVAVSAGIWVDPIDRDRLRFDDWESAVHEFAFEDGAPTYVGSGVVDGSPHDQFAFGEIGDDLAVVTSAGTPWGLRATGRVEMNILRPDGDGTLDPIAAVEDLSDGKGSVTAVRFLGERIVVSTGNEDSAMRVIDVEDHSAPRSAGRLDIDGYVDHLHPIGEGRALVFTNRWEVTGSGENRSGRLWIDVHLLDVADADEPEILDTWSRDDVSSSIGGDHHALTWWAERDLALWGMHHTSWDGSEERPNLAAALHADADLAERAVVTVTAPPEGEPSCPEVPVDAEVRNMLGDDVRIVRCDDPDQRIVTWSGFACSWIDPELVEQFAPGASADGSHLSCHPAGPPLVSRVLVVEGTPILYTDQTLEMLDPESFESTAVIARPTGGGRMFW